MTQIWVPPALQQEIAQDRAEIAEQIYEVEGTLAFWNKQLKACDPALRMIRAKPNSLPTQGLKPGYYHVIRDTGYGPVNITPLEYPNGAYREPGSWVFEHLLNETDMWDDRVMRDRADREKKLREAQHKQEQTEALERAAMYDERLASANRTQIHVKRKW